SVAISTMTWRSGSRPVISRSIQASIPAMVPRRAGHAVVRRRPATPSGPLRCGPVLEIPIVQLDPDLPLPSYATEGDAGADLVAREDVVLKAGGGRALVPTGSAIAIPEGYAGFVQPRSGLALKHGDRKSTRLNSSH